MEITDSIKEQDKEIIFQGLLEYNLARIEDKNSKDLGVYFQDDTGEKLYEPEDEKLLVEGVKSLTVSYDDGSWHGVFMDVEDLLDKRSCKVDPSLFLYMYQQTLCSSCRARLVQKVSFQLSI